jgi:pyruvate/2-oxoglutarate dehydrogenase complex dihydrolipoamide dehydrogenase (E3) component
MSEYDLIVIGAGPVGENVADYAKKGGLERVLVVESELVGGECSYWACMPSKALLRPAQALHEARSIAGAKEAVTGDLDLAAVFARRDSFVSGFDDASQVTWLESAGIELARGMARFTGPNAITVTADDGSTTDATGRAICIATGSAALVPDIEGLRDARPWTSREATSATEAPESLVVIGGGVVGCEMATAFASFGTRVTVIARGGLLGGMEPFAGELVQGALEEAGATVRTGAGVARVTRDGSGVTVELDDGGSVTAAEVLVATGRTPRTDDLGLETIGLEPGSWIDVDDTLRVEGVDWLYAAGDVTHRALLTHQGKYQARAAGGAIAARLTGGEVDDAPWGAHVATADARAVPQVTFTDPEVASVGMTASQADEAGIRTRVVDYDLGSVAGAALYLDGYTGKARMVVDEDRGVVVGVTFVGRGIAELLHSATIAVVGEVPLARLWHAVPSYPTISEVWLRFLEEYRAG